MNIARPATGFVISEPPNFESLLHSYAGKWPRVISHWEGIKDRLKMTAHREGRQSRVTCRNGSLRVKAMLRADCRKSALRTEFLATNWISRCSWCSIHSQQHRQPLLPVRPVEPAPADGRHRAALPWKRRVGISTAPIRRAWGDLQQRGDILGVANPQCVAILFGIFGDHLTASASPLLPLCFPESADRRASECRL